MGWLSASIGASGSLLGTTLTNATNRSENKKAYERNLHMWNLENEYNHPVQQMARLKEANLNPNMVYGSGATTLSASTKSSSAPTIQPYQFNILDALNSYQDIKQKDATINNINAQTQNAIATKDSINAQTQNALLQGDLFRLELAKLRGGEPTSKDSYANRLAFKTGQDIGKWISRNYLEGETPYNKYNYYKATLGGKK